jgi:RNA polymerase sigma-70 factor (ECF subfamily)
MRGELEQLLRSALDRLPQPYRSVFMLRAVEQLSTADTAKSLDLTEEAVKTRLHRARALMRRELESRLGSALTESYAFLGDRCDHAVAAVMERIMAAHRA